jgi:molecular chaperone HscB
MNDPFQTLGVAPRFDLDLAALEKRHRDLSRALHPDRYGDAPAAERRLSLSKAIEVNEAWRTLRDPVRRAEALLRLAGVAVGETREPQAAPALLMEIMDAREELAGAAARKDRARIAKLEAGMRAREAECVAKLGRGFDEAGGDAAKSAALLPLLGELRYLRRFLDEVGALEEELAG